MEPGSWALEEAKRASVKEEEPRKAPHYLSFPQIRRLVGEIALEIQERKTSSALPQSERQG